MQPKIFISYSWSSQSHQTLVKQWAEQLIADGIDVILDIFELKEGHDKYAFMERMVTDPTVTHVIVICDAQYAKKADAREAGVGTESQIISKAVYERIEQSKFIPIVCEFSDEQIPFLPTFLKSRIWIDFSSPETVNENWEKLVRLIYGKPLHLKPELGKAPIYISDAAIIAASPAITKFNAFRQALLQDRKGLRIYRGDFLSSCLSYADSLRVRENPNLENWGQKIVDDCAKLKLVRNHIVDWVLLESEASPGVHFTEVLIEFLDDLQKLKGRPEEINSWSEFWFDAQSIFVYETFLYIVAALLKTQSFATLHEIFATHYLKSGTDRYHEEKFRTFECFFGSSDALQSTLAQKGQRLHAPAAELLKRQADRADLTFGSIMEAELLVLLMALLHPKAYWYPQTLHYAAYHGEFQFFIRATQHKNFTKLATITGIDSADKLRAEVSAGRERLNTNGWHNFSFSNSFWSSMNMEKLDTLK